MSLFPMFGYLSLSASFFSVLKMINLFSFVNIYNPKIHMIGDLRIGRALDERGICRIFIASNPRKPAKALH